MEQTKTNNNQSESGASQNKPGGTTNADNNKALTQSGFKNNKEKVKDNTRSSTLGFRIERTGPIIDAVGASTSKDARQRLAAGVSARGTPTPALMESGRPKVFPRPDPTKATYQDRRRAYRILKRESTNPIGPSNVKSEDDLIKIKEDIAWAKQVMPDFNLEEANGNAKRQRSMEEAQNAPKRAKVTTRGKLSQSFAEVAKDRKVIGIIDKSNPEGKIQHNQWSKVVSAMAGVTMAIIKENPGPPPAFKDAGWFQGTIKIIACEDDRSVMLFKAAISKVGEAYPGAKLEVCDAHDIPSRPRARAWIPAATSDPSEIVQILQWANPSLPTQNWKVVKVEPAVGDKRQIVVLLNKESLKPLAEMDGELNFGFSKTKLKIYKADAAAACNLNACTTVEPPSEDEMEVAEAYPNQDRSGYETSESEYGPSLKRMYSECELLSESEEFDITLTEGCEKKNDASPPN